MRRRTAIIIGAGPAGLTAAYELLDKTDILPVVYEMTGEIGGISRTVDYRGNKMDIGGHRFFSKSERVMEWWTNILPLQGAPARDEATAGAGIEYPAWAWRRGIGDAEPERVPSPDPETVDEVMLARKRLSKILFEGKLYRYPVSLSPATLYSLGLMRTLKVGSSYARARLFPVREERSLEDFLVNRFGRELYRVFFKDYTEKVWGVPCGEIDPSWGAQRIKGLSVSKALAHAARKTLTRDRSVAQKDTETSLIERFLYPKYGPGQLWEEVARMVREAGGEIHLRHRAVALRRRGDRITGVALRDGSGRLVEREGDFFISTMPVPELMDALGEEVPREVAEVARGLPFRGFIAVGLLLEELRLGEGAADNWIYVQEPGLKASRMQIFNNWSPYLVADEGKVWVGLEYICEEGDGLWRMDEGELLRLATREMTAMGAAREGDILDGVVVKVPKVYPAYFGTYDRFHVVREYVDGFENLFLVGRNGMHRYNNQDHSMLTAMAAVECVSGEAADKEGIWSVNTEEEYHEQR